MFVCGDIAGDLQFSHAAEFHARIMLNNFFSPFNKKLNNDHLSWVTFTDPELATFGLSEKQLQQRGIDYERLEEDFADDDRAVTDQYRYGKTGTVYWKRRLAEKTKNTGRHHGCARCRRTDTGIDFGQYPGVSINAIFNKIYPYPVAARINQKLVVDYKSKGLTHGIKSCWVLPINYLANGMVAQF